MNKTAFTLVELIVTITILAILGTIAFVSLRMYISESKNSKVLNDLNSISTSLKSESLSGKNPLAFLGDSSSNIPNISLVGRIGTLGGEEYGAGNINFQAFRIEADKFKDPYSDTPYKIGIARVFPDSTFQVAGTVVRSDSGLRANKILGTYTPRQSTRQIQVSKINNLSNTVEILTEDIGYFYVGDVIESSGSEYVVDGISSNGATLTLDNITGLTNSSLLNLKYSESIGLIGSQDNKDIPVVEGEENFPY